jgi:hypothetical protein
MERIGILRSVTGAALALCALALAPGVAAARPAVVHKGAQLYQYCTHANGCWTAMFVYPKSKEFEVPEASIFGGTITTEKVDKKKYTLFTSDIESGAQCKLTGLKNSKGYSSEAAPGTVVCKEGSAPPYIEEAWWAVKV